jgi:hypothetical protein
MSNRWWVYQRERFPIFAHGPLIAVFSLCTAAFSLAVRGGESFADLNAPWIGFIVCFILFFQLRIADEFKDAEDDARYRPYRPVPRGLITLSELRTWGLCGALLQILLCVWLTPALLIVLAAVWVYFSLMSVEFFARDWLKARPITYLLSHMLIMPLVDFFAAACDWLTAGARPPPALFWFLVMSFCNGVVIELGRKIRSPEDEEMGVETYSALWGRTSACIGWLVAMGCTLICAYIAAASVHTEALVACVLGLLFLVACAVSIRITKSPRKGSGKHLEIVSAVWTLTLYISVGGVAYILR